MLRLKKNSYKEFDNEKSPAALKSPPPSHSFSNGRVPNFQETDLKAYFKIIIQREVATFLKSQMIVHFVLKTDRSLQNFRKNYRNS